MSVNTTNFKVNGNIYELIFNNYSGLYEVSITAPTTSSYNQNAGHYFACEVIATDEAGNVTTVTDTHATLGDNLKLKVKEKVVPVITITSPTASSLIINNKPFVAFTVMDADSGVNPDTIALIIDSTTITTGIEKTLNGKVYTCTYTPVAALVDGEHTIRVNASDYDGNAAVQKIVTFKIDTVPPTLSVTTPINNLVTNKAACVVSGTTNDAISSPCVVTIKLNSGAAQAATVNADGTFSKSLTLAAGLNTITVVSTDGAGKLSTVVRTVTLDTVAPTISSIKITPNPVDAGATFIITVAVED